MTPSRNENVVRVLLVEDDPSTSRSLAALLTRRGFTIRTAASAREALELAEDFAPQAAICDFQLAGDRDGVAAAEALRLRHPDLKIVFVSGCPASLIQERLGELPVAAVLTKPVSLDRILSCLAA